MGGNTRPDAGSAAARASQTHPQPGRSRAAWSYTAPEGDPAQRLSKYRHDCELQNAALAAFDRLCAGLGVEWEEARRRGADLLLSKGITPLVEVRCPQRHKVAGVWRTIDGPLFVASPAVARRREFHEGVAHVREPDAKRRILVVDLLDLLPEDQRHARLRCSCRCGLRDLTAAEREELREAVALARRTSRRRLTLRPQGR